jgi:hypothetical protein
MKYMHLHCVPIYNGPQILECTSLRSYVARWTHSLGNFFLCCLLCMQGVHKEISLSSNVSMPIDIICIWCSLFLFTWPSLLCQISNVLSCVMARLAITFALALVVTLVAQLI